MKAAASAPQIRATTCADDEGLSTAVENLPARLFRNDVLQPTEGGLC